MTIKFNAKQRQYEAHKEAIDSLLLQSITNSSKTKSIPQLEKDLAAYVGAEDAIVCNTQFNAFILLFMVLGLKPGDEVITSPLSSGIAVQASLFMGAKVIFVDVYETDFTLDVEQIEDAITERTKFIIPVSLFGNCADMESINALAVQHDLCVIEDAAESFGSRQNSRPSCQLSKLATTSFDPDMPLNGLGNGAALFIEDGDLRAKARELRTQGKDGDTYRSIGIEACMDEAQAAIVDFKLSIFTDEIKRRQKAADNYTLALKKSSIKLPLLDEESNFAYYPLRLQNRKAVLTSLEQKSIESKVPFTQPLHLHEAFSFMDYAVGDFPVSEKLANELLLLPLNAYLTREEQNTIVSSLLQQ
ncbi:MAG: aminotransferase class I/II-fold pyridoxal phosphate-dependent enzyme [Helicobacteraceae bacterium]|jgi:UDP-2-acetamido-2-deoxy-ribo-hexuluronate aminotransferase|nr:aminotransferase class I/II-fold pyridoxal phosphate-dependent enzyme [Helicobacteraceae bacterium]